MGTPARFGSTGAAFVLAMLLLAASTVCVSGQEQSCSKKGYTPCTAPSDKANGVKCCWLEGAGLGTPRCIALSPGVTLRSPGLCVCRDPSLALTAAGTCQACAPGSYLPANSLTCKACPTGSTSTAGSTTCTVPAGSRWTGTAVQKCDPDSYSATAQPFNPESATPTSCTRCPTGSTIAGTGSTTQSDCIVPAGSTVDSFGNVVACAPNTYQATAFNYATSGTPGCKACPGTSTSAAGSATCTVPAGSRWTGTTTEACAADSYSDQTRAINPVSQPPIPCTNCPTGSSTNSATGSTSIAACLVPAGSRWTGTAVQKCDPESYSAVPTSIPTTPGQATICTSCPTGSGTEGATGKTSQNDCLVPAGSTVDANTGNVVACGTNTFRTAPLPYTTSSFPACQTCPACSALSTTCTDTTLACNPTTGLCPACKEAVGTITFSDTCNTCIVKGTATTGIAYSCKNGATFISGTSLAPTSQLRQFVTGDRIAWTAPDEFIITSFVFTATGSAPRILFTGETVNGGTVAQLTDGFITNPPDFCQGAFAANLGCGTNRYKSWTVDVVSGQWTFGSLGYKKC